MPEMTKQEIFDKVARHLLTQNKRASRNNECAYLSDDGLKCAAGCLLQEGSEARASRVRWPGSRRLQVVTLPEDKSLYSQASRIGNGDFVRGLQFVHDFFEPSEWHEELMKIACNHKLDASVLESFS